MKCKLCNKEIKNYNTEFNHLKIDENNSCEICVECIDKFAKWRLTVYAKLFPTRTAKKMFEKKQ